MERQLRIMVLDTSVTSRKILKVIVSREGHEVVCFGDPLEALRFLSRYGPADMIFLGIDLPKVDGFGVLKHLRGEPLLRSMVPIVLISSRDGIMRHVRARLSGAQRVVRKPLVQSQIVSLVCEYQRWGAPISSRAVPKG